MPVKTVHLRSVELGAGRAKVCVPLVAPTLAALRDRVAALDPARLDLVELRVDHLAGAGSDLSMMDAAVSTLRDALPDPVPVLLTWRTTREGGDQPIDPAGYADLLLAAIAGGRVDAVDVEMLTPADDIARIIAAARAAGVAVVMSNHEFRSTPSRDEIVARLLRQQEAGADVLKIAVMPTSARDVVALLDATATFTADHAERPVITMAMGGLGVVSRIAGEAFGSCLSFGSVGAGSAPGQVEAAELGRILDLVHTGLAETATHAIVAP